jgi:hypothetical protein
MLDLGFLTFTGPPCECQLNKGFPQGDRDRQGTSDTANPDAIDVLKVRHLFGKRTGHDDRHVGSSGTLVPTELAQPGILPILRSLRFPKDFSAGLAAIIVDVL